MRSSRPCSIKTGRSSRSAQSQAAIRGGRAFSEAYRLAGTQAGVAEEQRSILSNAGLAIDARCACAKFLGCANRCDSWRAQCGACWTRSEQSRKLSRVRDQADLKEKLAQRDAEDRNGLIGLSIDTQSRIINTLLGRAPGTRGLSSATRGQIAGVVGIEGQGLSQAQQLFNEGQNVFAIQSLQNTRGLLDVRRQDLLEGIRGEQFDVRSRDLTNKRDTEDVGAILSAIDKAQRDLAQEIERIFKDTVF
jgi:hypothetical protein